MKMYDMYIRSVYEVGSKIKRQFRAMGRIDGL